MGKGDYPVSSEKMTVCFAHYDVMHFQELEWHVFGYEDGGYLGALCIYGQVDNMRPEDILKNK